MQIMWIHILNMHFARYVTLILIEVTTFTPALLFQNAPLLHKSVEIPSHPPTPSKHKLSSTVLCNMNRIRNIRHSG